MISLSAKPLYQIAGEAQIVMPSDATHPFSIIGTRQRYAFGAEQKTYPGISASNRP
jgi:hypothetical protein